MVRNKLQRGYFIVVALIIIIVIALFAATIVYMYLAATDSSTKFVSSERAYYSAQSGIEKASYALLTVNVNEKLACTQINSSNPNFTNVSFVDGKFSVTATYNQATTTLSSTINATDINVLVGSISGFVPQGGVILIDREAISYTSLGTNSFGGLVVRGVNGTTATTHFAGTKVSQKACSIVSVGTAQKSSVTLSKSIPEAGELWVVGNSGLILRGMANSWSQIASGTTANLYDISMSNYSEGWVVGAPINGQSTILHWNGTNFSSISNPGTTSLHGIWVVSDKETWVAGDGNLIMRWNGSQWTKSTIPSGSTNFYGISIVDSNADGIGDFGFAVGDKGRVIKYEGGVWSDEDIKKNKDLMRVLTMSLLQAFACGDNTSLYWRRDPMANPQWHDHNSPNTIIKGVAAFDYNNDGIADFGFSAGTNGATLKWHTNTPAWNNSVDSGGDINDISALAANDIWAVGLFSGSYKIMHFDGSSWVATTYSTSTPLNSIEAIGGFLQNWEFLSRIYY